VSLAPTKSDQEVTDALSKLTNEDLNVIIEDIYRIELAKMYKKQPGPWDWKTPQPRMTDGFLYANEASERMFFLMNGLFFAPPIPGSREYTLYRNDIILNLTNYFIKNYYNMDYDEQIQKMEEEEKEMDEEIKKMLMEEEKQKMDEEIKKMQMQKKRESVKVVNYTGVKNIKNVNPNDAIKKILEKQEEECNFNN